MRDGAPLVAVPLAAPPRADGLVRGTAQRGVAPGARPCARSVPRVLKDERGGLAKDDLTLGRVGGGEEGAPAAGRGALPRVDATADTRALRVERAGVRQGIVPPHRVGCAAK